MPQTNRGYPQPEPPRPRPRPRPDRRVPRPDNDNLPVPDNDNEPDRPKPRPRPRVPGYTRIGGRIISRLIPGLGLILTIKDLYELLPRRYRPPGVNLGNASRQWGPYLPVRDGGWHYTGQNDNPTKNQGARPWIDRSYENSPGPLARQAWDGTFISVADPYGFSWVQIYDYTALQSNKARYIAGYKPPVGEPAPYSDPSIPGINRPPSIAPQPFPEPLPYIILPHRTPNPLVSPFTQPVRGPRPGEQPSVDPRPAPLPRVPRLPPPLPGWTLPVPRPGPRPSPRPSPRPGPGPAPTPGTPPRPGEPTPSPRPSPAPAPSPQPHRSEPPPGRTKEKKVQSKFMRLVGLFTEGTEFMEALYDAIPRHLQPGNYVLHRKDGSTFIAKRWNPTPQQRWAAVLKHFEHIDVAKALKNLTVNEITDRIGAKFGQTTGKLSWGPWDKSALEYMKMLKEQERKKKEEEYNRRLDARG